MINEVILNAANNDELDEKAKVPVVQQKGRFKVTSENVDLEKVCLIFQLYCLSSCEDWIINLFFSGGPGSYTAKESQLAGS